MPLLMPLIAIEPLLRFISPYSRFSCQRYADAPADTLMPSLITPLFSLMITLSFSPLMLIFADSFSLSGWYAAIFAIVFHYFSFSYFSFIRHIRATPQRLPDIDYATLRAFHWFHIDYAFILRHWLIIAHCRDYCIDYCHCRRERAADIAFNITDAAIRHYRAITFITSHWAAITPHYWGHAADYLITFTPLPAFQLFMPERFSLFIFFTDTFRPYCRRLIQLFAFLLFRALLQRHSRQLRWGIDTFDDIGHLAIDSQLKLTLTPPADARCQRRQHCCAPL